VNIKEYLNTISNGQLTLRMRLWRIIGPFWKIFRVIFHIRKGRGYWRANATRKGEGIHGESTLCRERLIHYCIGSGIDLGSGSDPICPSAIPFDIEDGDVYDLSRYEDEEFDFVFSSHCLEHLCYSRKALGEWFRILKNKGYLVLYLPHADYYPNIAWGGNPDHCRDLYPEDVMKAARKTGYHFHVVHLREYGPAWVDGEWSFELVFQKLPRP
jgi:SAM-dependent methyltransferase